MNRLDSLDLESAKVKAKDGNAIKDASWGVILTLAFQSIGVVFGDLGTSPLYVYSSTFPQGIKHRDDIVGVLSLIYYTLTLLPVIKYVFIVLKANDNGNGGTFALYSLLCRNVKVGLIPNQQKEDREVANYENNSRKNGGGGSYKFQSTLENSPFAKYILLFATILAVSLVIGDGILTPCMSVLSATAGIKGASSSLTDDMVIGISIVILIFLFAVQRFGTDKVGYTFAPILCIWFVFNAVIGIYNFVKYDPTVIRAVNPWQIIQYFKRNGKEGWASLGGIILCITGTEALFADLGHFSVRSIQISMSMVVYPAILLQYSGQASYLSQNPLDVSDAFYKAVPGPIYWPMFVVAVLAAIIASQAMISGTFSIIHQSLALGCFPRVKVVHTSAKYEGQVYIPELNFFLMIACVFVTLGFGTGAKLGNAYGIAVVFAETITSSFMILVMILIWKKHILLVLLYVICILSVELVYLSAAFYKFTHGGYLPLAFACILMTIMFIWNYAYRKTYYYELNNKVSTDKLKEIVSRSNLCRVPGLAIFYSELVHGIPPIFENYVANVNAFHSILVFTSIKSLPISKVPPEERFLFRRVDLNALVFRCVVRYGYTDLLDEKEGFERILIERLVEFIKRNKSTSHIERNEESRDDDEIHSDNDEGGIQTKEVEMVENAAKLGVVHMMAESEVIARKDSNVVKKLAINYMYWFLKRNVRQNDEIFDVPRTRLLKVGMTYEL
ncbi:potassium transporter 5 [Beta vulgaris subsp. vulgaris]|uniref:potassium transporter 5 n=1 Tax=Beta vulgaris subsp. vulgaris TaxID=3555 RepID=UPI0020367442|nr:potassium transporter 5 [Beta vulgaris subsp. vulgaris]